MKNAPSVLKPQDIVVLLRMLIWKENRSWRFSDLSVDLKMSQSEVHQAVKRAQLAGLYDPLTKRPRRQALNEFIIHGLKYAFPGAIGEVEEGMPTAHSAPPLVNEIVSDSKSLYVWPMKGTKKKGNRIVPLHKNVPLVARKFPDLYRFLALIDALRVGRARERELAEKQLTEMLMTA
jgi:hypothetical protein